MKVLQILFHRQFQTGRILVEYAKSRNYKVPYVEFNFDSQGMST